MKYPPHVVWYKNINPSIMLGNPSIQSKLGVGMDDATMKRIFEKFYSRNSDPNEKGNGLGLSITKRIIDLMHGTIEVSSQVDEGSCFTVILPLEKA